jgi:hypothetical protein
MTLIYFEQDPCNNRRKPWACIKCLTLTSHILYSQTLSSGAAVTIERSAERSREPSDKISLCMRSVDTDPQRMRQTQHVVRVERWKCIPSFRRKSSWEETTWKSKGTWELVSLILKWYMGAVRECKLDSSGSGLGPVVVSYESDVAKRREISWPTDRLSDQEGLLSMELVKLRRHSYPWS